MVLSTAVVKHNRTHGDPSYGSYLKVLIAIRKIGGHIRGRISIGPVADIVTGERDC